MSTTTPSRTLTVTKGHGTGNDFVLFSDPDGEVELTDDQVVFLADRHRGVGGNGVIRAVRTEAASEVSHLLHDEPEAHWFMDYRNADGSRAEMCGNGVRVFVEFLLTEGLASIPEGGTLPIATRAGVVEVASSSPGSYQVDMGRWSLTDANYTVMARGLVIARPSLAITCPNPHVVVALASPEELSALELIIAPTLTPPASEGANIEFVVPADPLVVDGVGMIAMRVHERGVGETLSCGTGAMAAALATRHWAGEGAPHHWKVEVPGGSLGVRMFPTEEGEHVSLSGPATLVYTTDVVI